MIGFVLGLSFVLAALVLLVLFTVAGIMDYLKDKRKLSKKAQKKYNPKAGWYAYC